MSIAAFIAFLPIFALLNRARGGGVSEITDKLPGRPLYYVSMLIGAVCASFLGAWYGVVCGAGFLLWGAPGWGVWFDLHRNDGADAGDERRETLFVWLIDSVSFGSDHIALFIRHSVFVLPFLAAASWLLNDVYLLAIAPFFGVAVVAAYEIGWRWFWQILGAELLTGCIWWSLIFGVWIYASQ